MHTEPIDGDALERLKQSKAGTLGENLVTAVEESDKDFFQKVKPVSDWFAHDFLIEGSGESVKVIDLSLEEEVQNRFKARRIESIRNQLSRLSGDSMVHNQMKSTASVFTTLAQAFPDRIPKYFKGYEKSKIWYDGTLERFQDEIEPVILFAIDQDKQGKPLPSEFNELKALYEKSLVKEKMPDSEIKPETVELKNAELENKSEYYLFREGIRNCIKENWPDLLDKLESIIEPRISNNPDGLEIWEVAERQKRISKLLNMPPLYALEALLYEEIFGVNAHPGEEIIYRDSYGPTLGGMVSHGYPWGIFEGATLESVSKIEFTGDTAKEAHNSINDQTKRNQFDRITAEILYPTTLHDSQSFAKDRMREKLLRSYFKSGQEPEEAATTFSLRLLKVCKKESALTENIKSQDLKDIIYPGTNAEWSLSQYWHMLWRKMDRGILENDGLTASYKNPNDKDVKERIGELLLIRTHPEAQVMFKYFSPSGYLNEK